MRAFLALVKIYVLEVFAYKASAVIWVLGDLQVAILMPLVWRLIGGVGGMSAMEVTTYYLVGLTVSQFTTCHLLWDIAFDIREGRFQGQLLRPINHLTASFARNIAWRAGKTALFLPVLACMVLAYRWSPAGLDLGWEFWVSLLAGQVLAFFAAYSLSMLALWTVETVSIFELYYVPEMLLSGRVVPISAMPPWAQVLADVLPFKYTVSFPTLIAMGRIPSAGVLQGLAVQGAWIIVFWLVARFAFAKGTKQYYGFGL